MPKVEFRYEDKLIPKYHEILDDILDHNHTHYTFYGGRGSTKSSCISIAIPLLLVMNPDVHACVFRKVGNTLRSSVYAQIQWGIDQTGLYSYFKYKVNPMEIEFIPTGQKIMFFGMDDPQKIKSVKPKFGYIGITWFEESSQANGEAEIRTILQSTMRGGENFWDFRSFNPPLSASNWANKAVLEERDNTLNIKSSYLDVPRNWLGEAFFDEAERLKEENPKAYQHEYLGDPIGDGGNVFSNLEIREITQEEIDSFGIIYEGIDWGFARDPAAWVKEYYDPRRKTLYVYDELVGVNMRNEEFWDRLVNERNVTTELIYADSADPKSIADFKSYGANIRPCTKWNGCVDYKYHWLQTINKIVVDPIRCPETAREFLEYEYDRNKDGEVLSGYPDRENHCLDGCLYGLDQIIKRRGM